MALCHWVWGFCKPEPMPVAGGVQGAISVLHPLLLLTPGASARPSLSLFTSSSPFLFPPQGEVLTVLSPDLMEKEQAPVSSWPGWEENLM